MRVIKLGSSGEDVKRLCIMFGMTPRTVCDEELSEKLKAYQKLSGLKVDGIFGYKSWKKLLISDRYSKTSSGKVLNSDYDLFAWLLGCEANMIKAFIQVESGGSGFLKSGKPRILFESYQFYKNLKAEGIDPEKYMPGNEDIITSKWVNNYKGGDLEWGRLERARKISLSAANKSASWGLLQILGSNYKMCDEPTIDSFVRGMEKDEFTQLRLGIDFIRSRDSLVQAMISRDFVKMARLYNGSSFSTNKYDIKLKKAYYTLKNG